MKKITTAFAIAALFCCLTTCHKVQYGGQTGKIMHKKYDPALNINYIVDDVEQTWDTLMIDVDGDQTTDLKICFLFETPYIIAAPDWELSVATNGYINIVTWWNKGYQVFWEHLSAICLRHTTDEGPCYGWIDCYSTVGSEGQVDAIRFYLRETAYCTCPNYPLKWGEK